MDLGLSCHHREGQKPLLRQDNEDKKIPQAQERNIFTPCEKEYVKNISDVEEEEEEITVGSSKVNVNDARLIPQSNFHKYCYRHNPDVKCNKLADSNKISQLQDTLQKMPLKDQETINDVWSIFGAADSAKRQVILQGILSQCCFPQLSFISQEVSSLIRIDFISTLPTELSSKILCYLDCESLCNAAQVSKKWKRLADDDRVWHHMCEQHIDRKCPNCGWGLPLMHMKRAREIEYSPKNDAITLSGNHPPQVKRRRLSNQTTNGHGVRKTRPWKVVYSERFKVERNWRKGIYTTKQFVGHTDGVLTLKYDYKYLFTGSYDKTVKIWDVKTGALIRSLESHTQGVKTLAFDEQKLITGSLDNTIKVWNYHTGQCIATYRGHEDCVLSVDFYKKNIVSGSADTTVKLWNVESRTCIALRGHTEGVNSVKIHPQSSTIFSASDDTTVRMWDMTTHKLLKVFKGHIAAVQKVIPLNISSDYELVHDQQNDDEDVGEDEEEEEGEGIDYLDESRQYPNYILTASLDNTIKLWDVRSGKCVRTQFGHLEGIWDISADTFRIVSGAHDSLVKVWDLQSGKCMHTFQGHSSHVLAVGLGDSSFASADETGVVRMCNFDNFD
ncbi:ubiquitin-binding SDF ubiquitin ligase complex subunit MET30 [Cyberlindnera jadinii NRRL Y-1542]|uniref:WD40 repeat-like protein n=1 Tax=Cyberlindnera jadinii (strain ATCC 18201 / CBS 1600 / BCRC 20928 / JCM 3617 / NBRC 0987 / NRRL Y-1542) TaxID=983966 RepID=A0A1E4S568_CYBJN|nr:WD40 repeat-like protein [Cyberlindnera jadinii NRRL Y-1542]ODV74641.1 WD40 repeat-like protein [Cyberlindnera jadinii NRRL Y-1542]